MDGNTYSAPSDAFDHSVARYAETMTLSIILLWIEIISQTNSLILVPANRSAHKWPGLLVLVLVPA